MKCFRLVVWRKSFWRRTTSRGRSVANSLLNSTSQKTPSK